MEAGVSAASRQLFSSIKSVVAEHKPVAEIRHAYARNRAGLLAITVGILWTLTAAGSSSCWEGKIVLCVMGSGLYSMLQEAAVQTDAAMRLPAGDKCTVAGQLLPTSARQDVSSFLSSCPDVQMLCSKPLNGRLARSSNGTRRHRSPRRTALGNPALLLQLLSNRGRPPQVPPNKTLNELQADQHAADKPAGKGCKPRNSSSGSERLRRASPLSHCTPAGPSSIPSIAAPRQVLSNLGGLQNAESLEPPHLPDSPTSLKSDGMAVYEHNEAVNWSPLNSAQSDIVGAHGAFALDSYFDGILSSNERHANLDDTSRVTSLSKRGASSATTCNVAESIASMWAASFSHGHRKYNGSHHHHEGASPPSTGGTASALVPHRSHNGVLSPRPDGSHRWGSSTTSGTNIEPHFPRFGSASTGRSHGYSLQNGNPPLTPSYVLESDISPGCVDQSPTKQAALLNRSHTLSSASQLLSSAHDSDIADIANDEDNDALGTPPAEEPDSDALLTQLLLGLNPGTASNFTTGDHQLMRADTPHSMQSVLVHQPAQLLTMSELLLGMASSSNPYTDQRSNTGAGSTRSMLSIEHLSGNHATTRQLEAERLSFSDVPRHKGRMQVLLISDDLEKQKTVRSMLPAARFDLLIATSGAQALDMLPRAHLLPDVVLLDSQLGSTALDSSPMSVQMLLQNLRRLHDASELPVIFLVPAGHVRAGVLGLKNGANDYMMHPIVQLDLDARINTQVALRRAMRIKAEARASVQLLRSILPDAVIQKLKAGEQPVQYHEEVTVMFADIEGFTSLASQWDSDTMAKMLNALFSAFDEVCDRHGVYKVDTIGDAYMAITGHENAAGQVLRMMRAATEMLECARRMPQFGQPIHIRIGINTGPAHSGVLGRQRPKFTFWGNTVNVASRMQSQGFTQCIQLTAASYNCIEKSMQEHEQEVGSLGELYKPEFEFEDLGMRLIKGKGMMRTYLAKVGEWESALQRLTQLDSAPQSQNFPTSHNFPLSFNFAAHPMAQTSSFQQQPQQHPVQLQLPQLPQQLLQQPPPADSVSLRSAFEACVGMPGLDKGLDPLYSPVPASPGHPSGSLSKTSSDAHSAAIAQLHECGALVIGPAPVKTIATTSSGSKPPSGIMNRVSLPATSSRGSFSAAASTSSHQGPAEVKGSTGSGSSRSHGANRQPSDWNNLMAAMSKLQAGVQPPTSPDNDGVSQTSSHHMFSPFEQGYAYPGHEGFSGQMIVPNNSSELQSSISHVVLTATQASNGSQGSGAVPLGSGSSLQQQQQPPTIAVAQSNGFMSNLVGKAAKQKVPTVQGPLALGATAGVPAIAIASMGATASANHSAGTATATVTVGGGTAAGPHGLATARNSVPSTDSASSSRDAPTSKSGLKHFVKKIKKVFD